MKPPAIVLALAALTGCANGFGYDAPAGGASAELSAPSASIESPAPRRHQGALARGGIYDN